jgi:hypothetical protein
MSLLLLLSSTRKTTFYTGSWLLPEVFSPRHEERAVGVFRARCREHTYWLDA